MKFSNIEINLKPDALRIFREKQSERFNVIVAGRRYGKTFLIGYDIVYNAITNSKIELAYIAPTLKMARELMWNFIMQLLPSSLIKYINKTDMYIQLINNAKINLYGAAAYDSIRGKGFHKIYLDEAAYMPFEAWSEVLRQTIATTKGSATFISTPNGKANWFYDLTLNREYKVYERTSLQGGWIDEEEIESAKRQLDEKTFKQEYLASFETTGNTVYYMFGDHNDTDIEFKPERRTILAWDFNINPLCTIIIQEVEKDIYVAVKEFVIPNQNTESQCQMIVNWLESKQLTGNLEITGDYTGKAYHTVATFSDYNIIERYFKNFKGYDLRKRPVRYHKDRVAAINGMFKNMLGETRLFVNFKKCPKLVKDLRIVEWKANSLQIDKKPGVSDASDAFSYFPFNYYPLNKETSTVIIR